MINDNDIIFVVLNIFCWHQLFVPRGQPWKFTAHVQRNGKGYSASCLVAASPIFCSEQAKYKEGHWEVECEDWN